MLPCILNTTRHAPACSGGNRGEGGFYTESVLSTLVKFVSSLASWSTR
jgi:hypothetical protein